MPIFLSGKWGKAGAILLTKSARYIVPAVIAVAGVVAGFFFGKKCERMKGNKGKRA